MLQISVKKKLFSAAGEMLLNVALNIDQGSFVTIFGSSGAGKTSLLRMIAGLMHPDSGKIISNDINWFDSNCRLNIKPQSRKVGFVFQDYALFPNMTVYENLLFAIRNKQEKSYANELLEMVNLTGLADRFPETLSGGQKQRVALVRAIACKPDILLLDEPLSALDNETRLNLQSEIYKIHKNTSITTILISHNPSEVYRLSDFVYGMEDGKIVKSGKPDMFFANRELSGKVQMTGEIIDLKKEDIVFVARVLSGNNILKIIVTKEEADGLKTGDQVIVVSKAFNPLIFKI